MQSDCSTVASSPATSPTPLSLRNGVLALYGFRVQVYVKDGQLVCEDGFPNEPHVTFIPRANGLRRLVVLTPYGIMSFGAMQWLADQKIAYAVLDNDNGILNAWSPIGADLPALRRAQAKAADSSAGLEITRRLLAAKLRGQIENLRSVMAITEAEQVGDATQRLERAEDWEELRLVEAKGAAVYWTALQFLPVSFVRADTVRIPAGWKTIGPRSSPLTGGPRRATTLAHAVLNYCYALLEIETRVALLTVGLDPGLGLLHADQNSRDSLALDVMEAARPTIDRWWLSYITQNTFRYADAHQNADGTVLLSLALRRELTATLPLWKDAIAPYAESVRAALDTKHNQSTPLTQVNRINGRNPYRQKPAVVLPKEGSLPLQRRFLCARCGAPLPDPERRYCDACLPVQRREQVEALAASGPATLAKRREDGTDPAHGGEAGVKRGRSNAARAVERAKWEAEHGNGIEERQRFVNEIVSKLADVPLAAIQKAIGCSPRYASLIRRGLYIPHPMHYAALRQLLEVTKQPSSGFPAGNR